MSTKASTAPTAVERLDQKGQGRRTLLKAGTAGALALTLPQGGDAQQQTPPSPTADNTRNKLKIFEDALRRAQQQQNPPQAPSNVPVPQQPAGAAPNNNLAPSTLPARGDEGKLMGVNGAVDLDTNLTDQHPKAKEAYEALKDVVITKYNNTMVFNDFFARLYNHRDQNPNNDSRTRLPIAYKTKAIEAVKKVDVLSAPEQAEVVARIIRDLKDLDTGGRDLATASLGGIGTVMAAFPQAKNIAVKYTLRPTFRNSAGQTAYDEGALIFRDAERKDRAVPQTQASIRSYLSFATVQIHNGMMHLTGAEKDRHNLSMTLDNLPANPYRVETASVAATR